MQSRASPGTLGAISDLPVGTRPVHLLVLLVLLVLAHWRCWVLLLLLLLQELMPGLMLWLSRCAVPPALASGPSMCATAKWPLPPAVALAPACTCLDCVPLSWLVRDVLLLLLLE